MCAGGGGGFLHESCSPCSANSNALRRLERMATPVASSGEAWVKQQLALLPPDLRQLVEQLPPGAREQVLKKLVQQTELSFRELTESDVALIKERTRDESSYGFKLVDVGFTWDEIVSGEYMALGAFDTRPVESPADSAAPTSTAPQTRELPVAFIIGQLAQVSHTLAYVARETVAAAPAPAPSSPPAQQLQQQQQQQAEAGGPQQPAAQAAAPSAAPLGAPAFARLVGEEIGCAPHELCVCVWYLGVDYEFRRQGVGRQMMDLAKQVAQEAGARFLWLTVAEYNSSAVQFYRRYGFRDTREARPGERGQHRLMVLELEGADARAERKAPRLKKQPGGGKGKRKGGRAGGGGKKGGFGVAACACQAPASTPVGGCGLPALRCTGGQATSTAAWRQPTSTRGLPAPVAVLGRASVGASAVRRCLR